jgi:hypothetical protein
MAQCKYKNCNEKCHVTIFGKVRAYCSKHLAYFRDWQRANKFRNILGN